MRVGLYHGPLYHGANGYESYGPYARYVLEFARHFDEVVVIGPVSRDDTYYRGCSIEAPNVRVVELPRFDTYPQAMRHVWTIYRALRREIGNLDVVNCRHIAPFGYLLYFLGRRRGVGFYYHVTSDPMELLEVGPKYRGLLGRLGRWAFGLDFAIQKHVMRRTYSFVNGRLPFERLRAVTENVELVISSTLAEDDFRERTSYDLHQPVRLLYVGYLKHMKGLTFLIEAVRTIVDQGHDVELHLVGGGPEEAALRLQAADSGLNDRVRLHGYVPMGKALNEHYDSADVFVFPSLSEGSPRVVLEALAHSLPVISTRVGSVPDLIRDGESGLIVPVGDADAIAGAIVRFIEDRELRQRCGRSGFAIARKHTVEYFLRPLIEKAKELGRREKERRENLAGQSV